MWSGGSAADGDYPLLSEAIEQGLYHPRCRDSHTTYFPELEEEAPLTKAEERRQSDAYEAGQQEANAQHQAEKWRRLERYALDGENRRAYQARAKGWARLQDNDDVFSTFSRTNTDVIKPHNLRKNLRKTSIGREIEQYLSDSSATVNLLYGIDNPNGYWGEYDPWDDAILIYADLTMSIERTAEVLIHEATHRRYNIGHTQWAEAVCIAQEYKHRFNTNVLTYSQLKDIIKLVKKLYPEYPWK